MTANEEKVLIHKAFSARIPKLRPYKTWKGWYTSGPLTLYSVWRYGNGDASVSRFTPDRDGTFRQFEFWSPKTGYMGRQRGPRAS